MFLHARRGDFCLSRGLGDVYKRQFVDRYLQSVSRVSKFSGIEERWIKHTLGCLLARVHGRSPLEYLKDSEREAITEKTLECLDQIPSDIHTLIDRITWQPS